MIAGLAIKNQPATHGIACYIPLELPDTYELSPDIWLDFQTRTIELLQSYQAKEELAPCFGGTYGDGQFSWMVDQYFKKHGKVT